MSYNINISGHVETNDSAGFESALAERARAFVASVDGVTFAQLAGSTNTWNLLEGEVHDETQNEVQPQVEE
jgi:uncharacterized protein YqjF (DUF2071 family)